MDRKWSRTETGFYRLWIRVGKVAALFLQLIFKEFPLAIKNLFQFWVGLMRVQEGFKPQNLHSIIFIIFIMRKFLDSLRKNHNTVKFASIQDFGQKAINLAAENELCQPLWGDANNLVLFSFRTPQKARMLPASQSTWYIFNLFLLQIPSVGGWCALSCAFPTPLSVTNSDSVSPNSFISGCCLLSSQSAFGQANSSRHPHHDSLFPFNFEPRISIWAKTPDQVIIARAGQKLCRHLGEKRANKSCASLSFSWSALAPSS